MIPLYTKIEFEKAKNREMLPLQCIECKKTFYLSKHNIFKAINPHQTNTANCCSNRCQKLHKNPPIIVECTNCHKTFKKIHSQIKITKNNFCCRSCAATYNNAHKVKGTRISKLEVWLSKQLPQLYPNLEFHFNKKDAINSELDIYIPSLKLAFELNGIFHYEPIYGSEKLSSIQNNDSRKYQACIERQIELCIIDVSHHTYFKEQTCMPFLDIIKNIINLKLSRT
jgi:hypothetical protein